MHGCFDELLALMIMLGYRVVEQAGDFAVTPPRERQLAFVGDLVNRGPAALAELHLVISMVGAGQAFCVPGNQDVKLAAALKGQPVLQAAGLVRSLDQLAAETDSFRASAAEFLDTLPSHCLLDGGKLVIAHAGLPESMQGSDSARARSFAVNGETTGELDELGLPERRNWAADYRGKALVVFGHTPVVQPLWLNNTVNIDTGCVYGGHLTALRYPELETVSVPAQAIYSPSRRRFLPNAALRHSTN